MEFLNKYFKYENNLEISGLTEELNIFYMLYLFNTQKKNILVVTSSLYEANKINNKLSTYTSDNLLFPMDDFLSSSIIAASPELKYTRLETLDKCRESKHIVVTNLMGYLKHIVSKDQETNKIIKVNDVWKRNDLINLLEDFGYHHESLVTSTGEYAVRGYIIDVFLINEVHPIRFEFDGNNIESIRYFDESTQISNKEIKSITLKPIDEISSTNASNLLDYLDNSIVVYVDKNQIDFSYNRIVEDIFEYQKNTNTTNKLMFDFAEIKVKEKVYLNTFEKSKKGLVFDSKELINYEQNFEKIASDYNSFKKLKKEVIFYLSNDKEIEQIKKIIPDAKIEKKRINQGFMFNDYIIIGENDIEKITSTPIKYKKNYYFGKKISNYNQLEIGDYIVHIAHGIGIYNGIKTISVKGTNKDFLEILYAGTDKIYVPVEKITSIYKYADKDTEKPKLNSLSSSSWEKTKQYITKKISDISQELIKLYKERINIKTDRYKDYAEELMLAESFDYELTEDQKRAIVDINEDLKSDYPMDRLLCGDVGFGKTEVALRAMFKTILNNKQVMYSCPTTILSKQQYNVAISRFKDWPIEIAILNRNVSQKETKEVIEGLKSGKIDLVFGTHRLLSDDIEFKRLGLLVVDEEQRFGVTHKEKIKKLKTDINVLTLSATPIPRTLKMAMSGLRDLSIIDTPPTNRFPVQTYVVKEDDLLIKDAIYKELSRGGQIFILYNSIENIEKITAHINNLIPDAKVMFAHGRMEKNKLDTIMSDFVDKKFDILICTTIIESGIDIPNVNTLIIYDADNFGLSQLYQIRGRVGRSNRIAYAYLLYRQNKILNETAIKRLNTIKDFTELGSGYKIALRDLSIRGAGDIFGSSQAGFVDSIGINLYMKMIENEMKRQKGEIVEEEDDDTQSLINVSTSIDNDYINDDEIKIEIHQKINEIDSYEKLIDVRKEIEDRFGKISEDLLIYMYEEWFESIALKHNIKQVIQTDRYVEITIPEDVSRIIKGDKLMLKAFNLSNNFNIKSRNNRIVITLYIKNLEKHFIYYLTELFSEILD